MSPEADPPEGELEEAGEGVSVTDGVGVTEGDVRVADGVRTCAVEVAADGEAEGDDAVGLVQPAVNTHMARAAHTAANAICFFMTCLGQSI